MTTSVAQLAADLRTLFVGTNYINITRQAADTIDALLTRLAAADERIDALLARGEAAEADADRLARAYDWALDAAGMKDGGQALRLHDEAVALRERP